MINHTNHIHNKEFVKTCRYSESPRDSALSAPLQFELCDLLVNANHVIIIIYLFLNSCMDTPRTPIPDELISAVSPTMSGGDLMDAIEYLEDPNDMRRWYEAYINVVKPLATVDEPAELIALRNIKLVCSRNGQGEGKWSTALGVDIRNIKYKNM